MATERLTCPDCPNTIVLEVASGPTQHATRAQVGVRCARDGYRMEESERP